MQVARRLSERFDRETGMEMLTAPEELLAWLRARAQYWKPATWRLNQAALVYWLERHQAGALSEKVGALRRAEDVRWQGEDRTSAQKLKRIPDKDYRSLHARMSVDAAGGNANAALTLLWLSAGIWTGLRPSEWRHAAYAERNGQRLFVVRNAKATNGRAHGRTRTLIIDNLTEEQVAQVKWLAAHLGAMNDMDYARCYLRCRKYLAGINKALWPRRKKRITLYSARHQYSANLKKAGATRAEVAAAMGHASIDTAGEHYGRRISGKRGQRMALPSEKDVRAVMKLNPRTTNSRGQHAVSTNG
ncbi:hypothetical protein [Thiolapillus sp.]|uniref:hypothetical protein n=2 Tax=Thiolapillus sp. TaxID=2017437 RepID=UPI003AF809AD